MIGWKTMDVVTAAPGGILLRGNNSWQKAKHHGKESNFCATERHFHYSFLLWKTNKSLRSVLWAERQAKRNPASRLDFVTMLQDLANIFSNSYLMRI
jgi:hypothetical protein